jgi:hypothetical protein
VAIQRVLPESLELTERQQQRITSLGEETTRCWVVDWESHPNGKNICPIVRYSNGERHLLWPNGRLRILEGAKT